MQGCAFYPPLEALQFYCIGLDSKCHLSNFLCSFISKLNQAIISSESQPDIPVWQVEDKLLHESLMNFPKVHSAVFPVTSGSCGIERQDVSVYKLLQVWSCCVNSCNDDAYFCPQNFVMLNNIIENLRQLSVYSVCLC